MKWFFSKFTCKNRTVIAGCVYRPPKSSLEYMIKLTDILGHLHETLPPHDVFLLMGDFNLHIDWSNPYPKSAEEQLFCDTVLGLGLQQTVTTPTRGPNFLDLVFVNDQRFLSKIETVDNLPGLDHSAVAGILNLPRPFVQRVQRTILSYKDISQGDFLDTVRYAPWDIAFVNGDIEKTWELWQDIFWA